MSDIKCYTLKKEGEVPFICSLDQFVPPVRNGGCATINTPSKERNIPSRPVQPTASPLQSQARASTKAGWVKKIVICKTLE